MSHFQVGSGDFSPFPYLFEQALARACSKRVVRNQIPVVISTFGRCALAVFWPWSDPDGVRAAKKTFGDDLLIGSIVGQTVWSIEGITDWTEFAVQLVETPEQIHEAARAKSARARGLFEALAAAGADFVHIVNDVAFNGGPFVSPAQFREIVTPYLTEQVAYARSLGLIPFIHSDGDLTPVLDDWIGTGAACFQSVDPMAGMDMAAVKRRCHGKMALMGNVQCNLLQDGPLDAIRRSARYCLDHGAPGGGYIFGTSNTVFPGMPLAHYEYMLDVYREWVAENRSRT